MTASGSGNLAAESLTPTFPSTSLAGNDIHSGVSDTFDQALHDPSIAIETPGSQLEVSCPAADAWNRQAANNSSSVALTADEVEQRWIVSYMNQHPDQTLWELFTKTLDEDVEKWVHGPHPAEKAADATVDFVADVMKEFVLMLWGAFKWIVKFPFQARKEWKQVKDFGTGLWDGALLAGALFAKNPMDGLKTVAGGLLLHLLLHPSEFTAESILLVGAGCKVIHCLFDGLKFVAGAMPPSVKNTIMGVLIFIHMLDDPLLILTPILTSTTQAIKSVKSSAALTESNEMDGGFTSNTGSMFLTLPPNLALPVSKTCPLPSSDPASPPLTYSKLCLSSTPAQLRVLVFGTTKATNEMSREDRLRAYNHVRRFWCCYGQGAELHLPESIMKDIPGQEKWEGRSFWEDEDACQDPFLNKPEGPNARQKISENK